MALKGTGQFAQFATIYTGSSLDIHNTSSTSEFSTGDEFYELSFFSEERIKNTCPSENDFQKYINKFYNIKGDE